MTATSLLLMSTAIHSVISTDGQVTDCISSDFFVGEWVRKDPGAGLKISVKPNGQWHIGDDIIDNVSTAGGRLFFIRDIDGEKWTFSCIPHPSDPNKLFVVTGRVGADPRFHSVESWTAGENRVRQVRSGSSPIVSSGTWQVWLTPQPMEYRVLYKTCRSPNVELGDGWSKSGVTRQHRIEKGIIQFSHVLADEEATNLNVSLIPDPTDRNRIFVEWIRAQDDTKTILIATKSRE